MNNYDELITNKIQINLNDEKSVVNECQKFIDTLESNYESFKKITDDANNKFTSLINSKRKKRKFLLFKTKPIKIHPDFVYVPEKVTLKSPMTMINSNWGNGKTFFIEKLLELLIEEKVKLSKIKRIFVIDSWKFVSSKNVQHDFVKELFSYLLNDCKFKKNFNKAFKFYMKYINKIVVSFGGKDLSNAYKMWCSQDALTELEKINNKLKETILIFVDNIERLGNDSWEIIKVIQKLSMMNNFIFILSVNKENVFNSLSNNENSIDKFITLSPYEIIPSYKNVFIEDGFDNDISLLFDLILKKSLIKKSNSYTLRQVKNVLNEHKSFFNKYRKFNKYFLIVNIGKKFDIDEKITKEILKDEIKKISNQTREFKRLNSILNNLPNRYNDWNKNEIFTKIRTNANFLYYDNETQTILNSCINEWENNFASIANEKNILKKIDDVINSYKTLINSLNQIINTKNEVKYPYSNINNFDHIKNIIKDVNRIMIDNSELKSIKKRINELLILEKKSKSLNIDFLNYFKKWQKYIKNDYDFFDKEVSNVKNIYRENWELHIDNDEIINYIYVNSDSIIKKSK